VPSHSEQEKSEFQLAEHLDWYEKNRLEVQRVELGANDVPLDPRGYPLIGGALPPGQKLTSQLVKNEVFGGARDAGPPWWLEGGRKIPNVSGFDVPDYAVFAGRVRRKTGLSVVDAFLARDGEFERRFAVTVDMRLIPVSKLKPDAATLFHGVQLGQAAPLPLGFVNQRGVTAWKLIKNRDETKPAEAIPFRAVVPLSGKARIKAGARYYQTAGNAARWLKASEVGVVRQPPAWPEVATQGKKWIDVSLAEQTLALYEGQRAVYATLVSTGRDRMGDPKTTLSTPQGEFRIRSKHVAAAMDSEENSTVLGGTRDTTLAPALGPEVAKTIARLTQAEKEGKKLDEGDKRRLANMKKGRHPEYGITQRRGSQNYELRDVPRIHYFAAGYALHGAYWHDVFGVPRSHGCINLSPIDARAVFRFTEPHVPEGWHGVNAGDETGEGTTIVVRE
jgi:lipoprotein-anchoring transpeptidase ErfK/SrfK